MIFNWLQVLGTAECSQVDQRICHQLHPIVSLLEAFKAEEQSFKFFLPRKGSLDALAEGMDGGVEEACAAALGALAVAGVLWDVGDEARIENPLPIVLGIKAAIEVEVGTSEIQPNLFGHLLQGV